MIITEAELDEMEIEASLNAAELYDEVERLFLGDRHPDEYTPLPGMMPPDTSASPATPNPPTMPQTPSAPQGNMNAQGSQ